MSGVTPLKSKSQTDWNKCCLCQTEKKGEDLKSQLTHYSCSKDNDGCYMIVTNITFFQAINQLPIIFDLIRLDKGGGIEETLRRNNVKYQNCRLLFNNTKIERTRKRAASSKISSDDGQSKVRRTSMADHMCFFM